MQYQSQVSDPLGPPKDSNRLLSILIPTLASRHAQFQRLFGKLQRQVVEHSLEHQVEILWCCDNKERSVGAKRNALLSHAQGRFVVFVDDDDDVDDRFVPLICQTIGEHPQIDCIGYTGELLSPGRPPQPTVYSLRFHEPVNHAVSTEHAVYLRPPQHVSPMRRDIARLFPFPEWNFGEDSKRAAELMFSKHLQHEWFLGDRPMYRYQFDPKHSETQ